MPGRHLSLEQRGLIGLLRGQGVGLRETARQVGCHHSTVSRELRRDGQGGPAGYRAWSAQLDADVKRRRPKPFRLVQDRRLRAEVAAGLARRWSPEQVAGRLRVDYPDERSRWVSHTTIYRAIYLLGRPRLLGELDVSLRSRRLVRRPRREGYCLLNDPASIHDRPPEVADRAVPGHWEGDLLLGARQESAIATLVERTSRFLLPVDLPTGPGARTSPVVLAAVAAALGGLPEALRRSLTWDRGREIAGHARFSVATGIAVYVADAYSPWQRGSNENTNGLLREYLPKGTSVAVGPARLADIATELNGRPRKILGYRTPAEVLQDIIDTDTGATTT